MLKQTHGKLLTIYMQLCREQFQFKMFDIRAEIVLINPPMTGNNRHRRQDSNNTLLLIASTNAINK